MPDPFNGYLYLKHLRARWKVGLIAVLAAASIALAAGLLSPGKYTATVSLVIEPPAGRGPSRGNRGEPDLPGIAQDLRALRVQR